LRSAVVKLAHSRSSDKTHKIIQRIGFSVLFTIGGNHRCHVFRRFRIVTEVLQDVTGYRFLVVAIG
jgi:hypothetical protein